MPSTQVLLPELLYEVVEFLVAEYIDNTLASCLRRSGEPPSQPPSKRDVSLTDIAQNPCLALLQTSYQVRLATLVVLSQALNIDCDLTGLKYSLADYLHTARCVLWEAHSSTESAHKLLEASQCNSSATMQAYMLLADVQESTATILSLPLMFSIQIMEDTQSVFDLAKRTYVELLSGSYQPSIPEVLRETVIIRLLESAVELLACLPLRLNLCLRQLRIVKDDCKFTGQTLYNAYENAIGNIHQLRIILEGLYDLELSHPSRKSITHMRLLRKCSVETCDELCGLVLSEDNLASKHSELQGNAGQLRDMVMGQIDILLLRRRELAEVDDEKAKDRLVAMGYGTARDNGYRQ